ncbi:MAG: muraminidase [Nitrospira sp. LK70]|nr:muraminidase [Nitrospira sp. LK70]
MNICCLLVVSVVVSGLVSCATQAQVTANTEEASVIPGIFLETEPRAILPEGVELRQISTIGLNVTKISESFLPRLYDDPAGYCTIGYGHLVKKARCDGSEPREFLSTISEPRGSEILLTDMSMAELGVMANVTAQLTDGQYAALCDFTYNVGVGNLRKSTLLKVVNAGSFDEVPTQFRRYILANGKVLKGLKDRREKEIELFFQGLPIPRAVIPEGQEPALVDIRKGE